MLSCFVEVKYKCVYFIVAILQLTTLTSYTQTTSIILKGEVVDAANAVPMPFVNISYDNQRKGSVCSEQGLFQLSISPFFRSDSLTFSHIGYISKTVAIADFNDSRLIRILLTPASYSTPNITIRDIDAKKLIMKAIYNIEEHFYTEDHLLEGFCREFVRHRGLDELLYLSEGSIKTYKKGYVNDPSFLKESKRGHVGIDSGFVTVDEKYFVYLNMRVNIPDIINGPHMSLDLDMYGGSKFILNYYSLNYLSFEYDGYTEINGAPYYKIKFRPSHEQNTYFQGTLYYNIDKAIITGAEYEYNQFALDTYNKNAPPLQLVSRNFKVDYTFQGSKYAISFVRVENEFAYPRINHKIENVLEFAITNCITENFKKIRKGKRVRRGSNFRDGILRKGLSSWSGISIIPRRASIDKLVVPIRPPELSLQYDMSHTKGRLKTYRYSKGLELSKKINKPILLYFTASWCGPCRIMKREVLNLEDVIRQIQDDFIPVFLDRESGTGRKLASRYNIRGIPAFVIIDHREDLIDSFVGRRSKDHFLSILSNIKLRANERMPRVVQKEKMSNSDALTQKNENSTRVENAVEAMMTSVDSVVHHLKRSGYSAKDQDYVRRLIHHKERFISLFGSKLYFDKIHQSFVRAHPRKSTIIPRSMNRYIEAFAPEESIILNWKVLSDHYRHTIDNPNAAALAGLNFLKELPQSYLQDYHDFIAFIAVHLTNKDDLTSLTNLLQQSDNQGPDMEDHLNFLRSKTDSSIQYPIKQSVLNSDSYYFLSRYSNNE